MEELYANQYTDDENGDIWLAIYQGIYEKQSTRGNIVYPAVRHLGNINITQRQFLKGAKHPKKVVNQEGDTIILNGYDNIFTRMSTKFTELGYPQTLLDEITNVILTNSANPNIKTYVGFWDINRNGVVDF